MSVEPTQLREGRRQLDNVRPSPTPRWERQRPKRDCYAPPESFRPKKSPTSKELERMCFRPTGSGWDYDMHRVRYQTMCLQLYAYAKKMLDYDYHQPWAVSSFIDFHADWKVQLAVANELILVKNNHFEPFSRNPKTVERLERMEQFMNKIVESVRKNDHYQNRYNRRFQQRENISFLMFTLYDDKSLEMEKYCGVKFE